MMINKDKVYIEKREFVDRLNAAISMLPEIKAIEYRNIRDKYQEFLRVTYEYADLEQQRYINVTGDSLGMIAKEVSRIMLGIDIAAEVRDAAHVALVEGWFEAQR